MIRKTRVLMVLGLVLLTGGVAVALRPRSFGWTAYMPLADAVYSPWMVVLDAMGVAAAAAAALGLALLAGAVGYGIGIRRGAPPAA
ncbi:hypothetical protein [Georgenia yuyongxinii]|uniref:Uncharacterized protein n=1 Tax=Georgenia yuyongxinii TaxID=2589797 RepID=A0A552WQ18_9MICO|nr:hypothetical protein [Georgenia yuyongxinii]TRW44593.1 hypothetical protein FJ693_12925 [Georgenia yuyongxinii]